jgi:hypothetical protein
MHRYPELLTQVMSNNKLELDSILGCGLPWLRLNLNCPTFDKKTIQSSIDNSSCWRTKWNDDNDIDKGGIDWTSDVMFGPSVWDEWMELIKNRDRSVDFNHLPELHRNDIDFKWHVDKDNPIREWINTWLDDEDIYMIHTYVLPPRGFVPPHIDSIGDKYIAKKIYIPLVWPDGCEIGFNGFGNLPVQKGDVWLFNNRKYVHWAVNDSDETRVILNVDCNFDKIENIIKQSFLRR